MFSYIGFVTQEVAVGSADRLDVNMAEDATLISEIVVTGYGTQRKVRSPEPSLRYPQKKFRRYLLQTLLRLSPVGLPE